MLRKNFGDSSGVLVDVCAAHRFWFDEGELAQVLYFAASGEMEKAERLMAQHRSSRKRIDDFIRHLEAALPTRHHGI